MDTWELYCYSNKWIMDNLQPITDFHHIYLQIDRETQFAADLEFYGEKDYDFNTYDDEYNSFEDNYENENDYFSDNQSSSSDSEYDDFEYI